MPATVRSSSAHARITLLACLFAGLFFVHAGGLSAADRYVLPHGAGARDGSSWANAMETSHGRLQQALDALQPGDTLWIGSGEYRDIRLTLSHGGAAGRPVTIAGHDTGGGLPVFSGSFNKANPRKSGRTLFSVKAGASDWRLKDLAAKDYNCGLSISGGGCSHIQIVNFDVTGCREGIGISGGGTAANPAQGSHAIEIRDCDFLHYTKRAVRIQNGAYNVRVINCTADAGGQAWATEPFQIGFSVEGPDDKKTGAPDHDITFENCVARNHYNDAGKGYWNADGFCAEGGVNNLHYLNCKSFDNTDGGWDVKSTSVTLENCIALRNKRNYRFWGTVRMANCVGAWSIHRGGSGSATGLWASGKVLAERCTFHNNDVGIEADKTGAVTLLNSIVSLSGEKKGRLLQIEKTASLTNTDSVLWSEADGTENASKLAPRYVNPVAKWEGGDGAYDSRAFGAAKGYRAPGK